MRKFAELSPPNSIILVLDAETDDVPDLSGLVSATESCLVVGVLCEIDGPTKVVLADRAPLAGNGFDLLYQGVLSVNSGRLQVCTSQLDILFELSLADSTQPIAVWANDGDEPDSVWIELKRRSDQAFSLREVPGE